MGTTLKLVFIILIIVWGSWPQASMAEGISACAKKSTGALRITANKCKKNEIPLTLGQTGPMGPSGATGTPGAAGNIKVYDNKGQFIGFLMSDSGQIYIPSLQAIAEIDTDDLDGDGGYGDIRDMDLQSTAHYPVPDCGGPEYFWPRSMATDRIVKRSDGYYVAHSHTPLKLIAQSHRYKEKDTVDGSISICDNTPWTSEIWVVPGFDYTPVNLPFTTPLAFPLRLE